VDKKQNCRKRDLAKEIWTAGFKYSWKKDRQIWQHKKAG